MAKCERRVVVPSGVGEQLDRCEEVSAEYPTMYGGVPALERRSLVTTWFRRPDDAEEFHLVLSRKEAQLLFDVLRNVGGCPRFSRRKFADSIRGALADAGFRRGPPAPDIQRNYIAGLYFRAQNEKD